MSELSVKQLLKDCELSKPSEYWPKTCLDLIKRAEHAEARVEELENLLQLCYITIGNDKDSQLQVKDLERKLKLYKTATSCPFRSCLLGKSKGTNMSRLYKTNKQVRSTLLNRSFNADTVN